jgi:Flp pilus assembly protein TadD
LVLAGFVFVLYWPVLGHEFVYDDEPYIRDNPAVKQGLGPAQAWWALTTFESANWHPLTWLSLQLDATLLGPGPAGFHFTNLLLHALNAVLLDRFLFRWTGAAWTSGFVAVLFACHPLRLESVAWATERKDVLSGTALMLTLLSYGRDTSRPSVGNYCIVIALYALGLMAKPTLVTLPVLLLLLDFWPLERRFSSVGQLMVEKVPLILLAGAVALVTLYAQQKGGAINPLAIPWAERLANVPLAYTRYLVDTVWPFRLAVFHPYPETIPVWESMAAGVAIGGVTLLVIHYRRLQPFAFVGWLWYLIALLPMIGIIQAGRQASADRYTYIPQIGLLIAGGWGLQALVRRYPRLRMPVLGCAGLAIAICLVGTRAQLQYWHDDEALWHRDLAVTRNNEVARFNLGRALAQRGRWAEAVPEFAAAAKLRPANVDALIYEGLALRKQGRMEEAIGCYRDALRFAPEDSRAHNNLGLALERLGRLDEAIVHLRRACETNPEWPQSWTNLGDALSRAGRTNEAVAAYRRAAELPPPSAASHCNLAYALKEQGTLREADIEYRRASEIDPHWPEEACRTAWFLATAPQPWDRDGWAAARHARQAVQARADAHFLDVLAAAYAENENFDFAVATARQAIEISQKSGQLEQLRRITERLRLYETHRPYHEPE